MRETEPSIGGNAGRRHWTTLIVVVGVAAGLVVWAKWRTPTPEIGFTSHPGGVVVHRAAIGEGKVTKPSTSPAKTTLWVLKEYRPGSDQIVAASDNGKRVAVIRTVGANADTIVMPLDEPAPTTAPVTWNPIKYGGQAIFSPDGKRLAWIGTTPESGFQFAVVDGKLSSAYGAVRSLAFSADSVHCTYLAMTGDNTWHTLIDGVEQTTQKTKTSPDAVINDTGIIGRITDLQFSADGRHYAFLVHHAERPEAMSVFVDGIDMDRTLFGECVSFHFSATDTSGNILKILLVGPDHVTRLMELRVVSSMPSTAPATMPVRGN